MNVRRLDLFVSPMKLVFGISFLFLTIGLAVFLFPKFFTFLFASFMFIFGLVFGVLAWKIYRFKKQVEEHIGKFEDGAAIVINQEGSNATEVFEESNEFIDPEDLKKITLH